MPGNPAVLQTIKDTDWEVIIKASVIGIAQGPYVFVDASALKGAATDPRLSIVSLWWSLPPPMTPSGSLASGLINAASFSLYWDATADVEIVHLFGNGNYNGGAQTMPALPNNAGDGITGDIMANWRSEYGSLIVRCRKVSGYDNIL